ncbi:rhomboid family intramembrane serine protease [Lihuaxuella thermophila]|uniref:Rhomboid protease GluP n=1 Tax=Lihuaxuella thermophila TaxID=1173111 RepID=A0A1H8APC1_9BACL|nr:rhomboid family intramembrane serine protease [Lihuaxuella thermophila]SEM72356.1 rhomboid protease GluP [Lihuaxuella thermophila]
MFGHTWIPLRRFPQVFPVVTSILLVQTVVFVMLLLTGHVQDPSTWVQYGAYERWRVEEGEYWRLFFSLFVHTQFLHFLFTSFSIYIFAPQLEWLLGRFSFLILYLATGVIGNWALYLFDINGIYAGAASSVYGFMGVYLYLYFRRLIDPQSGKGLLVLILINLLLNFKLLAVHLMALITGFILGAIIITLKQNKYQE